MTLKKKILIGYGVSFALMSLVVVWAVFNIIALGKASNAILRENYESILAVENMLESLERQDSGSLLIFLGDTQTGVSQIQKNDALFWQWLGRAKDNVTIKDEADYVKSIEDNYVLYRQQLLKVIQSPDSSTSKEASKGAYEVTLHPFFVKVRDACVKLRRLNEEAMYNASSRASLVAEQAIWSTTIVALSALIIALIFSLFITGRIVQPLRRFTQASRKLSEGDYAIQIPVETKDELGRLASEFNQMAAKLGRYHEMNIEQIVSEKNKGEAILASIADGLVVLDTNLKITGINPAARQMLRLEFTDCSCLRCENVLPTPGAREILKEAIEKGGTSNAPDEKRIVSFDEDGEKRHFLFSVTPVRGRDRELCEIVLLLKDITQLKEVERLKSEFVMAASHELRTPLTGMSMSVDLLMEHSLRFLPEKDRELLEVVHEDVHRMKALVNDLLDLSKIEAGRIELVFENVPVTTLFERVLGVFRGQAEIKHVKLTSAPVPDNYSARADANKITWMLSNLISNALRYVEKGGCIQLGAEKIGNNIHFSVRDDGPGIPLDCQTKIFQKFVQVKGQDAGGAGLGLAICKEIAQAHGGTIWVESQLGAGSVFIFTLPAC